MALHQWVSAMIQFWIGSDSHCEWETGDILYRHRLHYIDSTVIGDFTKYGQPVPRPDPTRGVGIAHFQLWG